MLFVEKEDLINKLEENFIQKERLGGILRREKSQSTYKFFVDSLEDPRVILGICEKRPSYNLFARDETSAKFALENTSFSRDGKTIRFSAVDEFCVNIVEETLKKIGAKIDNSFSHIAYHLKNADISQLKELSKEVLPININDFGVVDSSWPYSNEDSKRYIKWILENSWSAGVYIDGELVSWALLHTDSTIGMIYTKETHRKKGLSKKVVAFLILKVMEMRAIPVCHVSPENSNGINLLESLGFQRGESVKWILASINET